MSNDTKVVVGLCAAVHPNMPGDDENVYKTIVRQMEILKKDLDFNLVVLHKPIHSEKDGQNARAFLEENKCDLSLLAFPSLPYGRAILPVLKVDSCLGLWAVPEPIKNGVLQLNSFCGLNMAGSIFANYVAKHDTPVKWFYDYADTDLFKKRFTVTLRAMRAIRALKYTRIGQIGELADGFENMHVDERTIEKKFGVYIQTRHTVEDIVQRAKKYDDREVRNVVEQITGDGSWNRERVTAEEINKMARVNKACMDFAEENNYTALAISCWTKFQKAYDLAVCGVMSRLNQAGIIAPCEADILSSVGMVVLKAMSGKIPTVNDMVALDYDDNSINLWHCGVAAKDWADEHGVSWDEHFNIGEYKNGIWDGTGVVADLSFKKGDVTVAAFQNDFKSIFVLTGSIINDKKPYYGSSGWMGNLKIGHDNIGISSLIDTIMTHRLTHHYPTIQGNYYEELAEFANWKKIDILKPVVYRPYMQIPDSG